MINTLLLQSILNLIIIGELIIKRINENKLTDIVTHKRIFNNCSSLKKNINGSKPAAHKICDIAILNKYPKVLYKFIKIKLKCCKTAIMITKSIYLLKEYFGKK